MTALYFNFDFDRAPRGCAEQPICERRQRGAVAQSVASSELWEKYDSCTLIRFGLGPPEEGG